MDVSHTTQGAQAILVRGGAVSYCVGQLIRRYQVTQKILNNAPLMNKEVVGSLLEGVIAPVWKLFETLGIAPSVPSTMLELLDRE